MRKIKSTKTVFSYVSIGLSLMGALFVLGIEVINVQSVAQGAQLGGTSVGGFSEAELREHVQTRAEEFKRLPVPLRVATTIAPIDTVREATTTPEELGIAIDVEATTKTVYTLGRNKSLIAGLKEQMVSFVTRPDIPFVLSYDQNALGSYFRKTFPALEQPAHNATLIYDPQRETFIGEKEKGGTLIHRESFFGEIGPLAYGASNTVFISQTTDVPEVTLAETDTAKEEAEAFLEKTPPTLIFEEKNITPEKDDYAGWLEFYHKTENGNTVLGTRVNRKNLEQYLAQLAPGLNRPPVNAVFTISEGRVTAFKLSKEGLELDIEESSKTLYDALKAEKNEVTLTVKKTQPELTNETINDLGITSLLAQGESNFAGSPKNRIHNIGVGASRFQGVLIKPGEEFSFNAHLGNVGPEEGYLPELVIKQDKTVPEYGGGLCQVSTTLFRAAIYAGLEITERFPHAFAVKYYSPQGFDATIYPPHPDLRFKNDTPGHILVQTRIEKTKLYFELYGTSDGRTVTLDGPHQYDVKGDGSMKAKLTYTVTRDGQVLREKTFYSNYKSPLLYPVQRNPLE